MAPEQNTNQETALVGCHSILGQVAAKRGDLDEADGHFANAIEEAKLSRLPMLEVLAARDWKEYLLEPNGRDCSAAEAAIDQRLEQATCNGAAGMAPASADEGGAGLVGLGGALPRRLPAWLLSA